MNSKTEPILSINNFSLSFNMNNQIAYAVKDISLHINKGEMVALVGESGCGKTLTSLSCMGLQPENAQLAGLIQVEKNNVLEFSEKQWKSFRGKTASMIFQEPMTSLNPLVKVGKQITETGVLHGLEKNVAKQKALELMNQVNLPNPLMTYNKYPHQLSGGQRQRIMIASALMNNPSLLIADEPTTALDVTTQAQIMELLAKMNQVYNTAILLVTHDLLLVKKMCQRVYIMYAGCILESGTTEEVLNNPIHPYTKALIGALPFIGNKNKPLSAIKGFVPPINKRNTDKSYLYERWPDSKNICYVNNQSAKVKDSTHKAYCHLHNLLEDV